MNKLIVLCCFFSPEKFQLFNEQFCRFFEVLNVNVRAQSPNILILSRNGRNIPELHCKYRNIPFLGSAKSQRIISGSRKVA